MADSHRFLAGWRARSDEEVVHAVRKIARDARAAGVKVVGADARLRDDLDPGEPVVGVTVVLADPQEGDDTWPLDAIQELRRVIRQRAHEEAIPYALSVQLRSAVEPPSDEVAELESDLPERLAGDGANEE